MAAQDSFIRPPTHTPLKDNKRLTHKQATAVHRESRGVALLFYLDARLIEVVNDTPRPLNSRERYVVIVVKEPGWALDGGEKYSPPPHRDLASGHSSL